jgi:hypothetical protein
MSMGLSGGSRVRRPGSEDPHRHEVLYILQAMLYYGCVLKFSFLGCLNCNDTWNGGGGGFFTDNNTTPNFLF